MNFGSLVTAIRRIYFRLTSFYNPWYGALVASQATVSHHCKHRHYRTSYSSEELFYWHPVAEWLFQDASQYQQGRILDVGSAYGTLAVYASRLCNSAAYCVDFTDCYQSKSLRDAYGLSFAVSNIELDPLPWEGGFDIIVFTEILEHLNFNPIPTMKKLRASLKPGGRLYLSTPDAGEWGRLAKYAEYMEMPMPDLNAPVVDGHIYQYTLAEVRELAGLTGFRVEREAYSIGIGGRHINVVLLPT